MTSYKEDFPFLSGSAVYLDSAATTQKPSRVIEAVTDYLTDTNSNIHRWAYRFAMASEAIYDQSKRAYADFIGAPSAKNIVYRDNATWCFNLLAHSLLEAEWWWFFEEWDNIIISEAEHNSNITVWQDIANKHKIRIQYIPVDLNGAILEKDLHKIIDDKTKIVSITWLSNVTGQVVDLQAISGQIPEYVLFIVDGSQLIGKRKVNVEDLWIDALIGTAHKMFWLTWLGMMYLSDRIMRNVTPIFSGGWSVSHVTHDDHSTLPWYEWRETGTPNVVGTLSLLESLHYIKSIGWVERIQRHDEEIVSYALDELRKIEGIKIIYNTNENHSSIVSFVFSDCDNLWFGSYCWNRDVCIRCWWHCAHILRESVWEERWCRLSFHIYTEKSDIDKVIKLIKERIDKN